MQDESYLDPFERATLERLRNDYRTLREEMQREMEELQRRQQQMLDELFGKAEEIKQKASVRAEAARLKAESEKPILVTARFISGSHLFVENSDKRDDLIEAFRAAPSRHFDGRYNRLLLKEWPVLKERLSTLPNVTIAYAAGVEERIDAILNEPTWLVSITPDRRICAKHRFDVPKHVFGQVVGAEYNFEDNAWYAPLTEAWRISKILMDPDFKEAVLTEQVQLLIVEQLSMRARVDKIISKLANDEQAEEQYQYRTEERSARHFQELTVEFLDAVEGRALVAHQMGLGKTWVAVLYAMVKDLRRVVIILPAKVRKNWVRIIRELTGEDPMVLRGLVPQRWHLEAIIQENPRFIIINYEILRKAVEMPQRNADGVVEKDAKGQPKIKKVYLWAETIKMVQPELLVLDEVHNIKNPQSNQSKACRSLTAPHLLGLSGTPVVNRPGEYWPFLNMLDPYLFRSFERFLTDYTLDGKRPRNVEQLQELLRTRMIRFTHDQVQKDLPPINRMDYIHELSLEALENYQSVLKGIYNMIAMYDVRDQAGYSKWVTNILTEILRLKQVCAADKVETTAQLATELYDSNEEGENKKVVIFTQFKGVAYRVAQLLGGEALCTVRKGANDFVTLDPDVRQEVVDQFQTDPNIHYLVTTTLAAGEGLDMTAAWYCIFNDLGYTPKEHEQAEGRLFGRLTDSHSADSYYIIAEKPDNGQPDEDVSTIDGWNKGLLSFKKGIINATVDGVEQSRGSDESVAMKLIERLKEEWAKAGRE